MRLFGGGRRWIVLGVGLWSGVSGPRSGSRTQAWLRAGTYETARVEAELAGVTISVWLDDAVRGFLGREDELRALAEREREQWGGWHPDDVAA
jgi:hypothetical protein